MKALDLFCGAGAQFSDCGVYRYTLTRDFGETGRGLCNLVMLNPSTATADQDDPTIRRCIGYARAWGCSGLVVTNLFAYRSTDPKALLNVCDPIGPDNDRHLKEEAQRATVVVCAWGAHGSLLGRCDAARAIFQALGVATTYLRLTKQGQPCHPLYLPGNLRPQPWP